jgi:hypothetical protein
MTFTVTKNANVFVTVNKRANGLEREETCSES